MKIIANFTEPYSTLNPDTSSDSPSAKSKGVRFNSAMHVIPHKRRAGMLTSHNPEAPTGRDLTKVPLLPQREKRAKQRKANLIS